MKTSAVSIVGLIATLLAAAPALAQDAACIERFKTLVLDGNPDIGPVRMHVFQEVAGQKTENYFYSPGGSTGDGLMQPLENMGPMWVLFRDRKMYTSMDAGKSWTFVRDMDDASQPQAYKAQLSEDLASADKVACGQDTVDGVTYDTVQGDYASTAIQGAVTSMKYWVAQDTGFIARSQTSSGSGAGKFFTLQIIEQAPDFTLPEVE